MPAKDPLKLAWETNISYASYAVNLTVFNAATGDAVWNAIILFINQALPQMAVAHGIFLVGGQGPGGAQALAYMVDGGGKQYVMCNVGNPTQPRTVGNPTQPTPSLQPFVL